MDYRARAKSKGPSGAADLCATDADKHPRLPPLTTRPRANSRRAAPGHPAQKLSLLSTDRYCPTSSLGPPGCHSWNQVRRTVPMSTPATWRARVYPSHSRSLPPHRRDVHRNGVKAIRYSNSIARHCRDLTGSPWIWRSERSGRKPARARLQRRGTLPSRLMCYPSCRQAMVRSVPSTSGAPTPSGERLAGGRQNPTSCCVSPTFQRLSPLRLLAAYRNLDVGEEMSNESCWLSRPPVAQ
jgi:hypothetical protein